MCVFECMCVWCVCMRVCVYDVSVCVCVVRAPGVSSQHTCSTQHQSPVVLALCTGLLGSLSYTTASPWPLPPSFLLPPDPDNHCSMFLCIWPFQNVKYIHTSMYVYIEYSSAFKRRRSGYLQQHGWIWRTSHKVKGVRHRRTDIICSPSHMESTGVKLTEAQSGSMGTRGRERGNEEALVQGSKVLLLQDE